MADPLDGPSTVPRPNVVVILADDMGWGDLRLLRRQEDQGVRPTNCHSASSVCSRSRYSLLTGRYAWRGPLRRGVADDTLLIATSDNGAMYADFRSPDTHGHASNGPWHGQKADIWDGGHREPFVDRFPGVIQAGSERHDPVGLVDLLPTRASCTTSTSIRRRRRTCGRSIPRWSPTWPASWR